MRKRIFRRRNNNKLFKQTGYKRRHRTTYRKNLSAQLNSIIASKIDFDKLPEEKSVLLDVGSDGAVKFDPNNPLHRRWIED